MRGPRNVFQGGSIIEINKSANNRRAQAGSSGTLSKPTSIQDLYAAMSAKINVGVSLRIS